MCGIFTVVEPAVDAVGALPLIESLKHRGPDDEGLFSQNIGNLHVGLAHTRLSIIDLSLLGHQPMQASTGGPVIVFNGEIYNFRELRGQLESSGHRFESKTDTEVLLRAYVEWGESCLDRLAGMWAFVIWDPDKQLLFGSRDRFGIKPLYYNTSRDFLAVASEIKALVGHPNVSTGPHMPRILDYFLFNLHDHTSETMFENIFQLPPAHAFRYALKDKKLSVWRYWTPAGHGSNGLNWTSAKNLIRENMRRSVGEHLVADVPVGFCLSGGVDSSAIVGVAREFRDSSQPMTAFTAAYDNSPFDEREYAQEVVRSKNIQWHVVIPTPARMFEDLDRLIYFQDEPPVHSSVYAQWCVMRLAKEHGVTVLLDGQGADELFAGYPAYRDVLAADLLMSGRLADMCRIGNPLRAVYGLSPAAFKAVLFRMRSLPWKSLRADVQSSVAAADLANTFENFQYRDLKKRMTKDTFELHLPKLLHYEDRNSMAFSLESRVPFLDHRLAESAIGMPVEWLLSDRGSKWILREALREYLPPKIADRRDKIGFSTPQMEWMSELVARHPELLHDGWAASQFSNSVFIEKLKQALRKNSPATSNVVWKLICLNIWHRTFLSDGAKRARRDRMRP